MRALAHDPSLPRRRNASVLAVRRPGSVETPAHGYGTPARAEAPPQASPRAGEGAPPRAGEGEAAPARRQKDLTTEARRAARARRGGGGAAGRARRPARGTSP